MASKAKPVLIECLCHLVVISLGQTTFIVMPAKGLMCFDILQESCFRLGRTKNPDT